MTNFVNDQFKGNKNNNTETNQILLVNLLNHQNLEKQKNKIIK